MNVLITDLGTRCPETDKPVEYVAACEGDCRGVDVHAYQMACMTGDVVRMGVTIAEPAYSIAGDPETLWPGETE